MKTQSIKINYILNTAYQILTLITPLITAPYISRVLGAEGVGIYSYTTSVVAFFTMFAVLGTTTYGQRAVAQCRDDRKKLSKCFWEIEVLSIFSTLFCTLAWIGFIIVNPDNKIYFLILTIDLVAVAFDIIWFYSGLEQFKFIVFRNAAIKIISIVCLFLFVKQRDQVWVYLIILSLGKFVGNVSMWIPLRKFVDGVRISEMNILPHFLETMAYFVPTAAASIYTYLDKVMIGAFTRTPVENGYYEQAQKIIKMGYTVLISLNTVMSARMSYLFALDKKEEIQQKLEKALAFIMTLGMPFVFGISGIAYNFVPWFFGDEFDKVAILMILSSPLILIMSVHNFLSAQYLVPSGQRVRSTKGVITGAVVNLVLNSLLIPRFQSVGAVVATLFAETSICVVYFYMSKEYVPVRLLFKYLPKQLIAAAAMLACVLLIGKGHSGSIMVTAAQIAAGVIIYLFMLYIMRDSFTIGMIRQMKEKISDLI